MVLGRALIPCIMKRIVQILTLILCGPALLFAREFHRVAVLPFVCEDVGEDLAWVGDGVTALLSDRLAETGRVRVLDPSRVQAAGRGVRPEDAAGLRSVGRSLKADLVIAGVCRRDGGGLRIALPTMVVEPDLYRADEVSTEPEHLEKASGKLAQKALSALRVRLLPDREDRLLREDVRTVGMLRLYAQAVAAPSAEARLRLYEQMAQAEDPGPDVLVRLGDAYLSAGRFGDAEGAYRRALIANPVHLLAANDMGVLRLREGRYDEAVAEFRKVCDFAPAFSDGWYNLGLAYQGTGEDTTAAGAYGRAIALEPGHTAARLNLGVLYARHGQFAQAIGAFEGVLREDPGNLPARLNLASALEKRGAPDSAAAAYEEVLRLRPEDRRARTGLAVSRLALAQRCLSAGRPAEAEAACRSAVALDSTQGRAYLGLSLALAARGDTLGSVREAERAVALSPEDATAQLQLGNVCAAMKQFNRASDAFRAATRLNAGLEAAWRNLGAVLIDAGRPAEAVSPLQKALALQPDAPETYANLGLAYAHQEDYASAAKAYVQALRLKPSDPQLHLRLGYACALAGQPDSERAAFERAAGLSAAPAAVWHEAGMFLEGRGRKSDAVAAYQKALDLDPHLAEARRRLGLLLEASEDRAALETQLSEAARQTPKSPEVWARLGALYADRGEVAKAADAYERAAGLSAAHAAGYRYNAGLLRLKGHQPEAARRILSLAASADPKNALTYLMLARADLIVSRPGEAVDAYRAALALGFRAQDSVRVGVVRVEMAGALKGAGRADEAIAVCRTGLKEDSESAVGHSLLGDLYAQQARYDLAVTEYERALKIDPARTAVYYALGRVCQQRGDLAGAIRYLQAYLDRNPGAEEADRVASAKAMIEALEKR